MGNKINAGNVDSFAPDKQKAGIEQLDLFIQQRVTGTWYLSQFLTGYNL
jgi:hypothetical protein